MSEPNPKLPEALDACPSLSNPIKEWDAIMSHISKQIELDRYDNRGTQYNRLAITVAAMLTYNQTLRVLVRNAGGDIKQFDTIVALAREIMTQETIKPVPGYKVACAINKLVDGRDY